MQLFYRYHRIPLKWVFFSAGAPSPQCQLKQGFDLIIMWIVDPLGKAIQLKTLNMLNKYTLLLQELLYCRNRSITYSISLMYQRFFLQQCTALQQSQTHNIYTHKHTNRNKQIKTNKHKHKQPRSRIMGSGSVPLLRTGLFKC